jgi:hypothetical protein
MDYFDELLLDDWKDYVPNIPDEILNEFLEPTSPYGSQRQVVEEKKIITEYSVSSLTRKTVNTVQISSVGKRFLDFALKPLNHITKSDIDSIISSEVIIEETVKSDFEENTISYLDYATFDDLSIKSVVLRNPSAGTISRIQELQKRSEIIEYVITSTESYRKTEYFKEVMSRVRNGTKIMDYKDLSDKIKARSVLYLGTTGNDLHRIPREERDKYLNVMGWAVNPFSVFSARHVGAIVQTEKAYEFEYTRKKWTRIEIYKLDPDCYRYSSQASIAYIQNQTKRNVSSDSYQLVLHRYRKMEEGVESFPTSDVYNASVQIPSRKGLEERIVNYQEFGEVTCYFKGDRMIDISLPFSYYDRLKYIHKFSHDGRDKISIRLGLISDNYVMSDDPAPEVYQYIKCMRYEFYRFLVVNKKRKRVACRYKEAEEVDIDGVTIKITRKRGFFVAKEGIFYHLFFSVEEKIGQQVECYEVDLIYSICPKSDDGKYLVSSVSGFPLPPQMLINRVPRLPKQYETQPFHYNDYVISRVKEKPALNIDITYMDVFSGDDG